MDDEHYIKSLEGESHNQELSIEELEAKVKEVEGNLKKYGKHLMRCSRLSNYRSLCDCGFLKAVGEL